MHRDQLIRLCRTTSVILLVCIVGCDGTSESQSTVEWVDVNEVQQGPIIHDTLPDELLTRIKSVHATFADVDGMPLDKWIDDFKRDLDPEGNISIWEDMRVAFDSYCSERDLTLDARKDVFKIVLMRSMMPNEDVLSRLEVENISKEDVELILAAYPSEATPISVIQTNE